MSEQPTAKIEPRAYSLDQLTALGYGSRSHLYEQIVDGRLEARKIGRRTVVLAEALERYRKSLPAFTPQSAA